MRIGRPIRQRGLTPMVALAAAVVLAIAGFLAIGPVSYTHLTLPTSDLV